MLLLPLLLLLAAPTNAAAAASASPTTMAVLPAGAVKGVSEALTVSEDLTAPGAPIVFAGATLRVELPKSGELQVSANATANWGNGGHVAPISNEEADIMGNAILWRDAANPRYDEIAELAPPALANKLRGVGPFTYSDLAYDTPDAAANAAAMWGALRAYKAKA